jgi:glycosyltransferase involved in cell wall biosynthesis
VTKLHVNCRFLSQTTTGTQRYSREVLIELAKLSNLELVLHITAGTQVPKDLEHLNFVISHLDGVLFDQLHMVLHSRGYALLSMSGPISILKKNQIAVLHDIGFVSYPNNFKFFFRTWYRFMYWVAVKNVRSLVSVSKFSADEIERHYGLNPNTVQVVPASGNHASKWKSIQPRVEGLDRPFYFMLGTLASRKNVLPTLEYLLSKGYSVVVCGSPGSSTVFKDAGASKPRGSESSGEVIFIPHAVDDEIAWLFENCEAFIFPSLYEGFGIPPLEALVRGAGVVSSDRASMPEVLGDFATFYDPEDLDSLSAALIELNTLPSRNLRIGWTQNSWKSSAEEIRRIATAGDRPAL